ncbi:MAG: radical SAM protein [Bacilli bacterium]|jgi:radical SAM protein with 4Fe4S-binding SPASM domain|nr:radical SAM protein [Bacilli bacterium]
MNYQGVKEKIIRDAAKKNIAVVGEFELTAHCNLSCTMCFVKDERASNLSTKAWKDLIQEAWNQGLLFCLFTGGEIFLRPDFQEIYEFTYDLGIRITLFTNGTLIDDNWIKIFQKRPPECIAITMYGSNPKMYERITKHKDAFHLVEAAIKRLQTAKLPFVIRTIAIKEIYLHLDEVLAYFKEHHFSVSYSLYVGPRRCSANKSVERLTPIELVDYDLRYRKAFQIRGATEFQPFSSGFNCVAGKSSFFVTHDGYFIPCAMLNEPRIKYTGFTETWTALSNKIKEVTLCREYEDCPHKKSCMQCPARRYLEGGFEKCSPYLKEIAVQMEKKYDL